MSKYKIATVFSAIDKMSAPISKMQKRVGKFTAAAEMGMRKVSSATNAIGLQAFKATKKIALGIASIGTASVVAASLINKHESEWVKMNKAVGANVETSEALAAAIASAGLESDTVIDLFEEMNNKLGESAGLEEITAVTESLGILGLRFRDVKKLSPEKQFIKIADAALKMTDATKAQAAMDILMGGEANKITGILREQGKSMDDIIKNYKELSFRTEKGRKGALEHAKAQDRLIQIFSSLSKEVSGLLGKHLTPMINKLNEYLIANKEIIGQGLDKFFTKLSSSIGDVSVYIEKAIAFIKDLDVNFEKAKSWAITIAKITAVVVAFMVVLNSLVAVMTLVNLVMAANPVGLIIMAIIAGLALMAAAATAIYLNWDSIVDYFTIVGQKIKDIFFSFIDIIKMIFGYSPMGLIINNWGQITGYFTDLFSGIVDVYENTLGAVMDGIRSAKDFLFGEDEVNVNGNQNVTYDYLASPQDRVARSIEERKETFDINVRAEQGSYVSSYNKPTGRLNLMNSGT